MNRRQFVSSVSIGLSCGLAGCIGGSSREVTVETNFRLPVSGFGKFVNGDLGVGVATIPTSDASLKPNAYAIPQWIGKEQVDESFQMNKGELVWVVNTENSTLGDWERAIQDVDGDRLYNDERRRVVATGAFSLPFILPVYRLTTTGFKQRGRITVKENSQD